MITKLNNAVIRLRSALWVRPTVASLGAAALALLLAGTDRLLPEFIAIPEVDGGSVKELLTLLASAMLTVTTVTLSALLVVLNMAVSQASPRALPGLMADEVTQNALSTFIATFVFALFGLLGLAVLCGFVLVRAVGFHHVDRLISADFANIKYNFWFENAGLWLIAINALMLLRRGR